MVLDDVSDDAELVKVAPAALCAESFLHDNLDVVDVLAGPHRREEEVAKPHDKHILHARTVRLVSISVSGLLGSWRHTGRKVHLWLSAAEAAWAAVLSRR